MKANKTGHSVTDHLQVLIISFFILIFLVITFMGNAIIDAYNISEARKNKIDSLRSEYERVSNLKDSLKIEIEKKDPRVIWTARAIYSETKRLNEMKYVGWVVRNRVENNFRGNMIYRDVILDKKQFSAFNYGRSGRFYYATKSYYDRYQDKTWDQALKAARKVVFGERPAGFDKHILYFYSKVSMKNNREPYWASDYQKVNIQSVNKDRFMFLRDPGYEYKQISYHTDNEENQIKTDS